MNELEMLREENAVLKKRIKFLEEQLKLDDIVDKAVDKRMNREYTML